MFPSTHRLPTFPIPANGAPDPTQKHEYGHHQHHRTNYGREQNSGGYRNQGSHNEYEQQVAAPMAHGPWRTARVVHVGLPLIIHSTIS